MPRTTSKKTKSLLNVPPDVQIHRPREVQSYLRRNKGLAPLVPPICEQVRREFGAAAELTLKIYHDPEIVDHYLMLLARLPSYEGANIMRRIYAITERFDDELTDAPGWFMVMTDFRKPGHGF